MRSYYIIGKKSYYVIGSEVLLHYWKVITLMALLNFKWAKLLHYQQLLHFGLLKAPTG